MDKLLPCPFCGGEPIYDNDANGGQWVHCSGCGCDSPMYRISDGTARLYAAWNRRTNLATPSSPMSAQSAYEECAEMARKIKLDRADILHRRNKRELAEQAFDTALAIEAAIRQLKEKA